MKTSFAYIDDVMERAVEAERADPKLTAGQRESAKKAGQKIVAGLRVVDAAAETKVLDSMIAQRRKEIDSFRNARSNLRDALGKRGIEPLAVVPTAAWYEICLATRLFILNPDTNGRVHVARAAFPDMRPERIDSYAQKDWPGFLEKVFPGYRSPISGAVATLILPDPPADISAILLKANGLTLKVAAVAEAIRFAEKPSDLMRPEVMPYTDAWAREQGYADMADWRKRDPIVFCEEGPAVAVIAQFGEFPIEQAVVDAVVKTDKLIGEQPVETEIVMLPGGLVDNYSNMLRQALQASVIGGSGLERFILPDARAQMAVAEARMREREIRGQQIADSIAWVRGSDT